MSMEPGPSHATSGHSIWQVVCVVGAGVVGLVLVSYAIYFVPNQLGSVTAEFTALLIILAILGVLSLIAALGYWMRKKWGWYVQIVSAFGQLLLPGGLFELKLDWYHLFMWIAPIASLVMVVLVGINVRRRKQTF